jgi:hypothetical protein
MRQTGKAFANLNALIHVIVNVQVLAEAKSINKGLLQMN